MKCAYCRAELPDGTDPCMQCGTPRPPDSRLRQLDVDAKLAAVSGRINHLRHVVRRLQETNSSWHLRAMISSNEIDREQAQSALDCVIAAAYAADDDPKARN